MTDRIIISFDDEQDPVPDLNKKIIIDLDSNDASSAEVKNINGETTKEIEKITGKAVISRKHKGKILSPGMLKSHYAPATPLYILVA